jgi:hypothetical protein
MSLKKASLLERVDGLLALGKRALETEHEVAHYSFLSGTLFNEFRSASLSFLAASVSAVHVYFKEFDVKVDRATPSCVQNGCGILRALRVEIDADWLYNVRALISVDIFGDYLDMAAHLLDEGFKDPAAVLVGGVLEGHLRSLAANRQIATEQTSAGRVVSRKADSLNADLYKATAYNSLDQKAVVAWLDLRNRAAHGHYSTYSAEQVSHMMDGVRAFLLRVPA